MIGRYELHEPLDSGRYGRVYRGTYGGRRCAIKVLPKQRHDISYQRNQKMIQSEKLHWQTVSGGPGIVPLFGAFDDGNDTYLASELCTNGSLMKDVKQGRMSEASVACIMRDVLLGVDWCHGHEIYHGDVKPANILMADDGTYKLCDFGCSQHTPNAMHGCTMRLGTPCYVAPEVFVQAEYGFAADVWSAGATAYVMLTGGTCPSKTGVEVPDYVSEEARDFLMRMLVTDPCKRSTASEMLRHPFVACARSEPVGKNVSCLQDGSSLAATESCSCV